MKRKKLAIIMGGIVIAGVIVVTTVYAPLGLISRSAGSDKMMASANAPENPASGAVPADETVALNDEQVKAIDIGPVGEHAFSQQRTAVGSIDFDENLSVQVFPPYQGKVIKAYADIGDEVAKGSTLYTIDSPDLIQAESTLIAAAGVYDLTTAALTRAKELYASQGMALKDYQQAISDQQTAEGALKSGRDAVRVFGKSDQEIDEIVAKRKIDPALVVSSPITGRVTARMAQPGLLVQPGNPPAPFSVADVSTMWMLANVAETDSPMFHINQEVRVKVMAYPDHDFTGKISTIGATVDPNTHTVLTRTEVRDPKHELRPGMFATYVITTGAPIASLAMPQDGVVREGDGTMTVWVTTDRHTFTKRTVKIGLQQDSFDQILDGLKPGEQVVTKGSVFLNNMLNGSTGS